MARRKSGLDVEAVQARCRAFPGAEERLYKPPGNVLLFSVGGKTFAYFKTSEPERWRFSLRVTPDRFVELTDMPGVKPAVGSSRVDLQACKLEYSIVSPK